MPALKTCRVGIVLEKGLAGIHGIDGRVVHAEESKAEFFVGFGDAIELMAFHGAEVLQNFVRHLEFFLMILSPVQPFERAGVKHLAQRTHLKGRIYADAQHTSHLLGIHSSHARADDDVRLFFLHQFGQKRQGFVRVQRNVGRNDLARRKKFCQQLRCATRSAGGEAVKID